MVRHIALVLAARGRCRMLCNQRSRRAESHGTKPIRQLRTVAGGLGQRLARLPGGSPRGEDGGSGCGLTGRTTMRSSPTYQAGTRTGLLPRRQIPGHRPAGLRRPGLRRGRRRLRCPSPRPIRPPKCVSHWEPAWSPDGSRLAVSTAGGAGTRRRASASRPWTCPGDWCPARHASRAGHGTTSLAGHRTPQARLLAPPAAARTGSVTTAVFVVNVNATGLRRLTPWRICRRPRMVTRRLTASSSTPGRWSTSPTPVESELCTVRPNGTGLRRLTAYGPNGHVQPIAAGPRTEDRTCTRAPARKAISAAHLCHRRRRHR